jgi:hypothetical protein
MNRLLRFYRHLIGEDFAARRAFPAPLRRRIAAVIGEQESRHTGELRFVVEGGLPPSAVLRGVEARERAVQLFSQLGVWDTEANNGVLIYLLLADRAVEIVADRGIHSRVGAQAWEIICGEMQRSFAEGRFEAGALSGLQAVSDLLAAHFPVGAGAANPDELTNEPTLV